MHITKGQYLIHVPTGRIVKVHSIEKDFFAVYTLDDIWHNKKTGKMCGGSAWILSIEKAGEFVSIEKYYRKYFIYLVQGVLCFFNK